jgi:hypothetical protein
MNKHVRNGIIYTKIKHVLTGRSWNFDAADKLDVLCHLLGKNILVGIRTRPPKLGVPSPFLDIYI